MKKRNIIKRIYLYVKRLSIQFEMWKACPYNLQVDLGRKR